MKPHTLHTQSVRTSIPTRRSFLTGLGALGAGSLFWGRPAMADSAKYAHRFQLFAEGTVDDLSLIWPTPQFPPLDAGLIVRVRIQFPVTPHDLLEWRTFVASETAPGQPLVVVTLLRVRVDDINLSTTPAPNFAMFGQVIDNPVVNNPDHSPFGDLTGRIQVIGGQFDTPGDNTTFTLLGGMAAGSHAGALRTARGSLRIHGPWGAF